MRRRVGGCPCSALQGERNEPDASGAATRLRYLLFEWPALTLSRVPGCEPGTSQSGLLAGRGVPWVPIAPAEAMAAVHEGAPAWKALLKRLRRRSFAERRGEPATSCSAPRPCRSPAGPWKADPEANPQDILPIRGRKAPEGPFAPPGKASLPQGRTPSCRCGSAVRTPSRASRRVKSSTNRREARSKPGGKPPGRVRKVSSRPTSRSLSAEA